MRREHAHRADQGHVHCQKDRTVVHEEPFRVALAELHAGQHPHSEQREDEGALQNAGPELVGSGPDAVPAEALQPSVKPVPHEAERGHVAQE